MIHGIAPFSGTAAVGGAGGYNMVNAVQYGVSRMQMTKPVHIRWQIEH